MGKISEKPSLLRSNLKKANTKIGWLWLYVKFFWPVFKTLKAAFKNILFKKLKAVEATLDIRGKTQYFLTKYPEYIKKFLEY